MGTEDASDIPVAKTDYAMTAEEAARVAECFDPTAPKEPACDQFQEAA